MNENKEELYARSILEKFSFTVERIPEVLNERRADYRVTNRSEEIILEVTDKKETQFLLELNKRAIQDGLATETRDVKYWNTIDRIIKDKVNQLKQTPSPKHAFRVLWFSALNQDGDFISSECIKTALGMANLVVGNMREIPYSKNCFYYNLNTFCSVPELDGLILVNKDGGQLCINCFSPKVSEFRESDLASIFPSYSVIDPDVWEQEGRAFILDGDIDRRDQKAKWHRLYEKYGVMTSNCHSVQFVGLISIPLSSLE